MKVSAAILVTAILLPSSAWAAGFDCKKARSEDEKAICASPELSKLDDNLTATFRATLELMSGDKKRIAAFRKNQSEWVKERSRCGDTVPCLKEEYVRRIRWLANPAHQYAGIWHANRARINFHVQKEDGLLYVALWPDKSKSPEQQDMVFMTIGGKFSPAKMNPTAEDQIIIAPPQFSLRNASFKAVCPEIRLSFGTAEMMGLEAGDKCSLLKGPDGDFRPVSPTFIYEPSR